MKKYYALCLLFFGLSAFAFELSEPIENALKAKQNEVLEQQENSIKEVKNEVSSSEDAPELLSKESSVDETVSNK